MIEFDRKNVREMGGLGDMGPLALSGTAEGLVNLVSLNGGLKICKTLPGHSEEVVSMEVQWGDLAIPSSF